MPIFACAAMLPDGERVNVTAMPAHLGARLLSVRRIKSGRDVLPRLTDHARRMLREQVETAMQAEIEPGHEQRRPC